MCLDSQGHATKCTLEVDGAHNETFRVTRPAASAAMRLSHGDAERATEHGAEGVAFLVTRKVTPYTAIEQMRKGTAADWWLGYRGQLLQRAARLECSGVRAGEPGELGTRTKQKVDRAKLANPTLPTYVCVTSFKYARARLVLI